jgi:phospholipid-binding lipoprotein MlaA
VNSHHRPQHGAGARALILAASLLMVLSGCATRPEASDKAATAAFNETNDRLEPLNRTMFRFDEGLDAVLIHPLVWVYDTVIPGFVRRRVTMILDNVRSPITFVNDVLQGEPHRAGETLARLMINTTVGLGGMFDVANSSAHIRPHTEDFGQTLAVWGVKSGSYLYLPLLGPSSIRDGVGLAVDEYGFDPIAWYSYNPHNMQWVQWAELGAELIDAKSTTKSTTDELKKSSIDYYATLRAAYWQYRAKEIRNGKPAPASEMPNFDSEEGDPFADPGTAPAANPTTNSPQSR